MPRPERCRQIGAKPSYTAFKPQGIPSGVLEQVTLQLDELEAVRLVDLLGMYQEEAAAKLSVSRQTLGNILETARRKITDVIANGKALVIEGGTVHSNREEALRCPRCQQRRRQGRRNTSPLS
jgi:uncharacterized protein